MFGLNSFAGNIANAFGGASNGQQPNALFSEVLKRNGFNPQAPSTPAAGREQSSTGPVWGAGPSVFGGQPSIIDTPLSPGAPSLGQLRDAGDPATWDAETRKRFGIPDNYVYYPSKTGMGGGWDLPGMENKPERGDFEPWDKYQERLAKAGYPTDPNYQPGWFLEALKNAPQMPTKTRKQPFGLSFQVPDYEKFRQENPLPPDYRSIPIMPSPDERRYPTLPDFQQQDPQAFQDWLASILNGDQMYHPNRQLFSDGLDLFRHGTIQNGQLARKQSSTSPLNYLMGR